MCLCVCMWLCTTIGREAFACFHKPRNPGSLTQSFACLSLACTHTQTHTRVRTTALVFSYRANSRLKIRKYKWNQQVGRTDSGNHYIKRTTCKLTHTYCGLLISASGFSVFPTKAPLHHAHSQAHQLILTTIRVSTSHLFTTPVHKATPATSPSVYVFFICILYLLIHLFFFPSFLDCPLLNDTSTCFFCTDLSVADHASP